MLIDSYEYTTPGTPVGNAKYVRQGATGGGSSWSDAFGTLPATLLRGYTYYIAKGSYGSYSFDDAASGTQTITIKRATVADHGDDLGWNNSYDGTVFFSGMDFPGTTYYVIDGATYDPGYRTKSIAGYGIQVINPSNGGQALTRLDDGALGGNTGATNITFRNVLFKGKGRDNSDFGDFLIYGIGATTDNITFFRCAFAENKSAQFKCNGIWTNLLIERCLFCNNTNTHQIHGEALSLQKTNNFTFRYNWVIDIEGSGVIAAVNGGQTSNNWDVYGNVFWYTDDYLNNVGRIMNQIGPDKPANDPSQPDDPVGTGIGGIINFSQRPDDGLNGTGPEDATLNNCRFYNNTIVNCRWTIGFHNETPTGVPAVGNYIRNNIYYYRADEKFPIPGYGARTSSTGYNVNSDNVFRFVWDESNATPAFTSSFVDITHGNFHLATQEVGAALTAPYDYDMDGNQRTTWTVGAFEFTG